MKHLFPRQDEIISFPVETRLDRRRGSRLVPEVNDEHGTMTVCVGSGDEWREAGKMGPGAQRLAYISLRPP